MEMVARPVQWPGSLLLTTILIIKNQRKDKSWCCYAGSFLEIWLLQIQGTSSTKVKHFRQLWIHEAKRLVNYNRECCKTKRTSERLVREIAATPIPLLFLRYIIRRCSELGNDVTPKNYATYCPYVTQRP